MKFTIKDILDDVRNDGFWEKCEKSNNELLRSYKLTQNTFRTHEECDKLFDDFMTQYFLGKEGDDLDQKHRHVCGSVAREHFYRLHKDKFIQKTYTRMIEGIDGGVYKILKQLLNLMFEESVSLHITGKVAEHIKDLEIEEKIELANQYIDNFPEYLPQSLSDSPVLIAVKLEEVILEHIKVEKKIGGSIA